MIHIFPRLYDVSKNGKNKVWQITVQGEKNKSLIITETGYMDGKITTFTKQILEGKNLGKANETTHFTQPLSEAKSKWKKQNGKNKRIKDTAKM
jgi:hypothetical protein